MRAGRSRSSPADQAALNRLESRICSLSWTGSAETPDQPQDAGGRRVDAVAQGLWVLADRLRRGRERLQDAHRQSGVGAGRVDGDIDGLFEARDALRVLIPLGKACLPVLCLLLGELIGAQILLARLFLADPRPEVFGAQLRKGEEQVGQVTLGVDDYRRHTVYGSLFQADRRTARSCRYRSFPRTRRGSPDPLES